MVGIDIGSHTIKIVELEKEGNSFNLQATGAVAIKSMPIDKFIDEKDFASLGQIIKKLHNEAGVSSKDVILSIPESVCFTRNIQFPLLTDSEIASAVKWESEQYIPIPINEAIIQHTILERNEKATPPEIRVLLVAAPKVIVEKYVKVVSAAGLNVVAVETELIALTRSLAPVDKTIVMVDLGASSTDIAIAKNGLLFFSRSIPIAGEAFTRAVSQGLGITAVQAEEYKKSYGLDEKELEGKIKGALNPVLLMVVDEVKKAIHYYQSEQKGEAPASLIISGGTSGMPQIISMFTSLLGMEVLVANPFSKVSMDPATAKRVSAFAPLYAVSVGLAMRDE